MHGPVLTWVDKAQKRYGPWHTVLDMGSYDVNGSPRSTVHCQRYTGIDLKPGPGVDVVCSAGTYVPDYVPDVVLCLEVLEHAKPWKRIIKNAAKIMSPHGTFVLTCATDPREPHGMDGHPLPEGEFYANIDPEECKKVILKHFRECEMEVEKGNAGDLRIIARGPIQC